jgi:ElaA protein
MINFKCIRFNDFSVSELYQCLALRSEVFVVEQNCVFQDIDGKDPQAWHCLGYDADGQLVAYTRLFDKDDYYSGYASIGRVVNSPRSRGQGFGLLLMHYSISQCEALFGPIPIKIGAQKYLLRFYESLGFASTGEDYMEDGILHTIMLRSFS